MGNSFPKSIDIQSSGNPNRGPLIQVDTEVAPVSPHQYGRDNRKYRQSSCSTLDEQHEQDIISANTNNRQDTEFELLDLYPYLTYSASINKIQSSLTLLENISNIISEFADIKSMINKSFQFKLQIERRKDSFIPPPRGRHLQDTLVANILCGVSRNGIVYLIAPINHQSITPKLYCIDGGYFPPHSKQYERKFECRGKTYSFDSRFCCVISHYIEESSFFIDGIIVVSSAGDTIYGLHLVNNNRGLFVLRKFNSDVRPIELIDDGNTEDPNDDVYRIISIEKGEYVVHLWRQHMDAFVLTSKFHLYGISITSNTFQMDRICTFTDAANDMQNVEKYTNCYYSVQQNILFFIYKNRSKRCVEFKMYKADRGNMIAVTNDGLQRTTDVVIAKPLQQILNYNYIDCQKSVFLYHKPSNAFLLFFSVYLVQMSIDFEKRALTKINIGVIDETHMNYQERASVAYKLNEDVLAELNYTTLSKFTAKGKNTGASSLASDILNMHDLPEEPSICDRIIGYDELRSSIILNLNRCIKELDFLYKFNVNVQRASDFASDWKSVT